MGQTSPQAAGGQSPLGVLAAYNMMLPMLSKNMAAQIPKLSDAITQATISSTPQLNQLNLDQLQKYGPAEARIGNQIAREQALSGAGTNLLQLEGAGGNAARAAVGLNKELNPDYYRAIGAASKGSVDALNAVNLNGLSPGESAAIERSLNQTNSATGNLGLINPMNTINNAMNFGGAFNNKVQMKSNLANNAAGVASVAAGGGGVNPVNIALGQPNVSGQNFGSGQFINANSGSSNTATGAATGYGSNILSSLMGGNSAALGVGGSLANNTSPTSYMNSAASLIGSVGSCCFIFMESYDGVLPASVRRYRDAYYHWHPTIALGYKRMARWLVPLMRKYNIVKKVVSLTMTKPLTKYSLGKRKYKLVAHSWLRIWAMIGKH